MFDVEEVLHESVRHEGPCIDWERPHHADHIALEEALYTRNRVLLLKTVDKA